MRAKRFFTGLVIVAAAVTAAAAALFTYSRGRDQCPQCGYLHDLHACKHCGWTACLACWQSKSSYNTCPSCGRSNP